MGEFAIFTPEVAEELINRGFELVARSEKAYYFNDSAGFRDAVNEILYIKEEKEFSKNFKKSIDK